MIDTDTARAVIQEVGLVGRAQLPALFGISVSRAYQMPAEPGFPEPVEYLGETPVYIKAEVIEWRNSRMS
jgi:predicted DNA-binding transcriptional regulator AlpA